MPYSKEAKAAWRHRPEVQAKAREYKKNWNQANRQHINKYMRDRYRARVEGRSTTKQTGLFDGDTH